MYHARSRGLGPLDREQTAVVVGGGPAGASCAVRLKQLAEQLNRSIQVVVYEPKQFEGERHFNQCVGVLSPPIVDILERQLKVPFPWHLVQREIHRYMLHSDREQILLEGKGEPSYAVHRISFDAYLLRQAAERGIRVVQGRVTDLEFTSRGVMVYSDSENVQADVVVGAFGMDDGGCQLFERATSYSPPRSLTSIVTRIYPDEEEMQRFTGTIHAFLPSIPQIEFGAVSPKRSHLTVNIAGAHVTAGDMDDFLRYPPVRRLLPAEIPGSNLVRQYFKGRFPVRPARRLYGDRYVTVGDASGLLRPFKGKGINSGCLTGIRAADTILKVGISRRVFDSYYRLCEDVTQDLWYGRVVRHLAILSANGGWLDTVIILARTRPDLQAALFDCVSGHRPYREIRHNLSLLGLFPPFLHALGRLLLRGRRG